MENVLLKELESYYYRCCYKHSAPPEPQINWFAGNVKQLNQTLKSVFDPNLRIPIQFVADTR